MGHSWTRKLAEAEREKKIMKNGGFDAAKHECRYVTCVIEVSNLYRCRYIRINIGTMIEGVGVLN